jgi:hypothetical protein
MGEWDFAIKLLAVIGGLIGFSGGGMWWLSSQFSNNRAFTYKTVKQMEKRFRKLLKSHMKDDAMKFDDIKKELQFLKGIRDHGS